MMGMAVCIRCGNIKRHVLKDCRRCGLDPTKDELTHAKSLRLSSSFLGSDQEPPSKENLLAISKSIQGGQEYEFDDGEINSLLNEKNLLERRLSAADIAKIVGYVGLLLVPAIAGVLYWLFFLRD